ncbi:uncharacterized protein LOC126314443 [Schistocerca gregaria]|uniref:uncharacterized protein LOC126314443 n=1 Tax=Schistocerca gregaria TaxID=7010 RepID=UPI00211E029C|nr:uncharacterized protein LOC126314443 [Schistocerca gregaria]
MWQGVRRRTAIGPRSLSLKPRLANLRRQRQVLGDAPQATKPRRVPTREETEKDQKDLQERIQMHSLNSPAFHVREPSFHTFVPFLSSSIYSKNSSAEREECMSKLKHPFWKRHLANWIIRRLTSLNKEIWASTDECVALAFAAIAEAFSEHDPHMASELLHPSCRTIMINNYKNWSRIFDYRLKVSNIKPVLLSKKFVFHLLEFRNEAPCKVSILDNLELNFSTPIENYDTWKEQSSAFLQKLAFNYDALNLDAHLHLNKQIQAETTALSNRPPVSNIPEFQNSKVSSPDLISSLFPHTLVVPLSSLFSYLRAVRFFGTEYFWRNSTLEIQLTYQISASHSLELFDSLHDSRCLARLKDHVAPHLVTFSNKIPLRSSPGQPPSLGQWLISDFDEIVLQEKLIIEKLAEVSSTPQHVLAKKCKDIAWMGLKPGQDLAKEEKQKRSPKITLHTQKISSTHQISQNTEQ